MATGRQRVFSEELVEGLYVAELDRPWLDSPFLFQGFVIEDAAQLEEVRAHCEYVYIDLARSQPRAVARLPSRTAPTAPAPRAPAAAGPALPQAWLRAQQADIVALFGDEPWPDPEALAPRLRHAARVRHHAHQCVKDVFAQARLGRLTDEARIHDTVAGLLDDIADNAAAALWLTNLRRRDEYTSIHCLNVCVLALAFGRHLGLARDRLRPLGVGALLHDIGKSRTPAHILHKPGPLTDEEFAVIRRHPEDGYRLLRDTPDLSQESLEIVRRHHERVNGRGYPDGLVADQISLPVLVVALADVYDAMTSDRVYRQGLAPTQALGILRKQSEQFTEELVYEFLRCLGLYPPGSVVELNSGAVALVMASDPNARLRPMLRLLRDPEGRRYADERLINVAALPEGSERPWFIKRALVPAEMDLDLREFVSTDV